MDSRIIDDTCLHAESVQLVDLNGDGKMELLMNNHEKDSALNGIWAFTPYFFELIEYSSYNNSDHVPGRSLNSNKN